MQDGRAVQFAVQCIALQMVVSHDRRYLQLTIDVLSAVISWSQISKYTVS